MFEALFILTTMDTGPRVARYAMQELMGRVHNPIANTARWPGTLGTTMPVVLEWGCLIYTGNISTSGGGLVPAAVAGRRFTDNRFPKRHSASRRRISKYG